MLNPDNSQRDRVRAMEDAIEMILPATVASKVRVWVVPVGNYLTKTRVWSILEKDGTREGVVTDG